MSQTLHRELGRQCQPVVFSQSILKLGRKMSILYKIQNLIFNDHTRLEGEMATSVICFSLKQGQQGHVEACRVGRECWSPQPELLTGYRLYR